MLVDLTTAKLSLRVDGSDEDALITLWLEAAEAKAVEFLGRNVYADQNALNAAVAAVPAALFAATTAHTAAVAAARALTSEVERDAAEKAADDTYADAQESARRTRAGIVVTSAIKTAVLLTVAHLYAHREDVGPGNLAPLPHGAHAFLWPMRVDVGV